VVTLIYYVLFYGSLVGDVHISYYGIVLVGFLLLCSASTAAETEVSLNTSTKWLVAGSGDTSNVTVTATNATTVVLSCNSTMGTVTPSTVMTNATGKTTATATFRAGTMSGDAVITATALNASGAVVAEDTTIRRVDHAAPYRLALKEYTSEATVGSEVSIVLAIEDRYGNRIDNRREVAEGRDAETVTFSVGSPDDSAVFVGTGKDTAVCPVDGAGNVTVTLGLGRKAGENIVYVDLPSPIADAYFTFYGLSDAPPTSITCAVSPDGTPLPWVPADGKGAFTLTYTLKDAYGNPAGNRSLLITTSLGESLVDPPPRSNSDGRVVVTYGPKDSTGKVTITATSKDNSSVTCSQTVAFTSTDPVDMLLTASPQTMPGLDVNPSQTAEIRAKVMDEKGNPVTGENVTFDLSDINTAGYVATADPALLANAAVTDGDGYATVLFRPGAFINDRKAPGYSPTATGSCTVTATWEGVSHTLPLTWKNYPYLSVSTAVDSETVAVNGTVNVTVSLRGDGYALQPDPIDVVLVMDRSGSMSNDDPSRISSAKAAAKTFVSQMNPTQDHIGLVSYSTDASCVLSLSDDYSKVNRTIDALKANGWTATRKALYLAIQEMVANESSNPDAVHAVILISDGEYNYYGDPLARGTGSNEYTWGYTQKDYYTLFSDLGTQQNMSVYAKNNTIRLYMISFSNDIREGSLTWKTMDTLAETTGGKHYHAATGDDLARIYTEIAGDLKTEAGVNTTMDLVMQELEVNNAAVTNTVVDPVLEYCFMPGASTAIESWTDNRTGRYQVVPLHTEDQTADWEDDRNLRFDIGTVRLGQTWTATYTLKVLGDGNINIFGPRSALSFNGGADSLDLPDTFLTAVPDLTNTGMRRAYLDLDALRHTGSEPVTDFLTVGWRLNYTGSSTTTQRLFYSRDGGKTWVPFLTMASRPRGERDEQVNLDVRSLASGKYLVRVHATAPDAPDDGVQLVDEVRVGSFPSNKIRLE
jgi:hypothetical protein